MADLTERQAAFVREYLVDLNATQAAIRAGYSEKSARELASRMLRNVNIQAALTEAIQARAERTEITADRVLQELAKIAFVDVRRMFNEVGNLRPLQDLDDDTAAAIAAVEIVAMGRGDDAETFTKKVRLWDKKGALELLGKHLGMFRDKEPDDPDKRNVFYVVRVPDVAESNEAWARRHGSISPREK